MKETELYLPVKQLFETLGYTVHGEVSDMDIVALKEDEMIAIELKTAFGLKLITQAALRQKLTQHVYVAIPAPTWKKCFSKACKDQEYLLRRLEIGLIWVKTEAEPPTAIIRFDPKPYNLNTSMKRNQRKKTKALKEISERHGDYNVGGTGGKKVTAYREKTLIALHYCSLHDEISLKDLRVATGNGDVSSILYRNYYGWFQPTRRGYYALTEPGRDALVQYKEIIEQILPR